MHKLTVIIVTFLTDKNLLINCLNSISKKVKILIIENSKNFKNKNYFLNKYPNLKIKCTGQNLGYGGGNNFGLKISNTDFVLILNPDTVLDKNFFSNLNEVFKKKDFSLIGCQYKHDKIFMPAGFFKKNEDKNFKKNYDILKNKDFIKVDWIAGCSILVNLKKFKHKKLFDDNFFLYFEEYDLCKQLKRFKKKVFLTKKLQIHHYGFKSSSSLKLDFFEDAENLRNWHWMWSYFYYHKKNFGYIFALINSFDKLLKSLLRIIFHTIFLNKSNKNKYLYRFLGLFCSMIGMKSFYRGKYFK